MNRDERADACCVYEGRNEICLPMGRGKGRIWRRIIAFCLMIAVIGGFSVYAFGNGGFSELIADFANFAVKMGFPLQNNGGGAIADGDESETGTETDEDSRQSDATETESGSETAEETESEERTEESTEQNASEVASVDLSQAEKGDGYLLNYTGRLFDTEGMLEMGFADRQYYFSEAPSVLILHTHTSEGYYDADRVDGGRVFGSVVAVGEQVSRRLNRLGIPALHCTVIHDSNSELDSYESAADTVRTMLEIYPTVKYVIDIHRLTERATDGRLLRTCSTEGFAQIRLTVSTENRAVTDCLTLALCLRRELNDGDGRLCMPVVVTDSALNAGLGTYYLKIDVGSQGNLTGEAVASGELLAEALAEVIKK